MSRTEPRANGRPRAPAVGADAALDAGLATLRAFAAADPNVVNGRGLEALVAGAVHATSRKTWLLPGRRERMCALLRGCAPESLDAARPYRVVPAGQSPSARALVGVGLALAGENAVAFLGTGSVGYGGFLEAMNIGGLHRAPITFLIAWYADAGPFAPQLNGGPVAVARGFGWTASEVDGTDAAAVHAVVASATGPTLVVARLRGA